VSLLTWHFFSLLICEAILKEVTQSGAEEDEIICKCMQISESLIRSVISRGNLNTIEQVTEACTAGGGCHSCHILIQLFINEHQGKIPDKDQLVSAHGDKVQKKGVLSIFFSKFKSSKD
tara:strand:+ start:302 stop:658 length:357 start_codon:yes stop_codon:yes gene_type:complete